MSGTFLDRVSNKALGQMLVEKGSLSPEQLDEALAFSRSENLRLGAALVQLGFISQDALGYALGEQYGVQPMELHPGMADPVLLSRFPFDLLDRHTMLPLIELAGELVIVVGDPNDQDGLRELQSLAPNLKISAQLGNAAQIRRCLDHVGRSSARSPHTTGAPGASHLPLFQTRPAITSPDFAVWLAHQALSHFKSDILIRPLKNGLQVAALPATGSIPHTGLTELAVIEDAKLSAVRDSLLRRMEQIQHTSGQAYIWAGSLQHEDHGYRLLALIPRYPAEPMIRLRALRLDSPADEAACSSPFIPTLEPGRCTPCVYAADLDLDTCLAEFFLENLGSQVFVLLQATTRTVFAGVSAFPAPFGDVSAVATATGATCVIFDHPVPRDVVDRLLTAVSPPPAVAVCIAANAGMDAVTNPWLLELSDDDDAPIASLGGRGTGNNLEETN